MRHTLVGILVALVLAGEVSAQVFCTPIGTSTYCDTNPGAVTITPLTPTHGVIVTPKSVEAYTILPAPPEPQNLGPRDARPDPFGALLITEPSETLPDPLGMEEE